MTDRDQQWKTKEEEDEEEETGGRGGDGGVVELKGGNWLLAVGCWLEDGMLKVWLGGTECSWDIC